ncbi:hypothetical protein F0Q45_15175 [Mycobacterium simiae]|uniref:Immunity protein 35 domain-containing protein n=1 Tax=Mycobacterium simiae TaxID=1784 RepID=A0A5B1BPS3_MYCSI|nr:hypothetical protein [Mycobacterium simiae]KAA1249430.1 hypothetical protein F0Q45_15175 [Mycobacterium simiae]
MNETSFEEARLLATDAINQLAEQGRLGDLMIVDSAIIETAEARYFPYDAVSFLVLGNVSAALAGNVPVKVTKMGSEVTYEAPAGRGVAIS